MSGETTPTSLLSGNKDDSSEDDKLLNAAKQKLADNVDDPELDDSTPTEVTTDEEDPEVVEPAMEEMALLYLDVNKINLALEDGYLKEKAGVAATYALDRMLDGARYIKEAGVEYGPVILEKVFKGVLYALEKTLKAITLGSAAIAKYIKNRIESFVNFKKKIAKLREAVNLHKENNTTLKDVSIKYTNTEVLNKLTSHKNPNIQLSLSDYLDFMKGTVSQLDHNFQVSVEATRNLIGQVLSGNISLPNIKMNELPLASGFIKHTVSGYESDSDFVDSYAYHKVLPGDVCFIAQMPKRDLKVEAEVSEAYQKSRMCFGIDVNTSNTIAEYNYLDPLALLSMLDTLDELCNVAIGQEKHYKNIDAARNKLKVSLRSYADYLFASKSKISLKESLAGYVSLKTGYMDKSYLTACMMIHNYNVRLLTASLTFIRGNVGVLNN